ncbi:MAG: hypothetical protein ACI9UA_000287 [Pseudoalteromonas tetraodonis]|jgi:hypothetical protein
MGCGEEPIGMRLGLWKLTFKLALETGCLRELCGCPKNPKL